MATDVVRTDVYDIRDRVGALVADDPADYLPATAGGHGWRRIFGRLELDPPRWAMLAYEPDVAVGGSAWSAQVVEMFDAGEGGSRAVRHPAGDLLVTSIVDDPSLAGLRLLRDLPGDVSLLRYRPQRRCTLRISGAGQDHIAQGHIAKVLADRRGEQFDRDAVDLWNASQRGELSFRVAEPLGWDATTRSVSQGIVPGSPAAATLLAPGGAAVAERMGAALGSLARSNVHPSTTVTSTDQLHRTQRAVENAIRRLPELAADLARILDLFADRHAALSADRLVPVHGAPHMHQWLMDDEGQLGLIDFDRFALGEVELDIATLLVELDYEEDLRDAPTAIADAVVDGYEANGVEIDRSRLRLYGAHKRLSKVTREAWALRLDGNRRASRHLSRIEEELSS